MNLSDLISNLMSKKFSALQTEPGVTYGPAVSRSSRTPIQYGSLPANRSGEFNPQTDTIKIDPIKGNVPAVTRHESVHALLSKLPNSGTAQSQAAPGFSSIAERMHGSVAGNMEDEVPAYMAMQPKPQFYGISDDQRNAYMQGLVGQLQKLDPSIASKMQQLSQRSQ